MVEVEGFGLLRSSLRPGNFAEVLDMATAFNKASSEKILIYKAHQKITYSFDEVKKELRSKIKDIYLPDEAVTHLHQNHYCVVENNLFFISSSTADEVKTIYESESLTEKIKSLSSLSEPHALSDSELKDFIESAEQSVDLRPEIDIKITLYSYQKLGVEWLKHKFSSRSGGILADDMGLGKTAQVIALIADTFAAGTADHALILVPNSLIANWVNEFNKFTVGIDPYIHWGPNRAGFASQLKKNKLIISTYSTISNDLSLFSQIFFDILVCDEASLLKNPDSQRTQSVSELSFGTVIEITGTPFENSMLDLWSLSNLIAPDYLGDRSSFESQYVRPGVMELSEEEVSNVEEKLKPMLLRRMKQDVLSELPTKLDIPKPLTMSEDELVGYSTLENNIKSCADNKGEALAMISHLRKYSAHPMLSNETLNTASLSDLIEASAKFSYLSGLIEKIKKNGDKALIFANHIKLLDCFCGVFSNTLNIKSFKIDGTIDSQDRQAVVDAFSAVSGSALLFLNPITAGMGLNITAASHVIHYSRQWNPALEEQATARAYRNGQKNHVNVYYLYYANSIEEVIHERILAKSYVAGNVVRKTSEYASEDEMILNLISVKA